MSTKTEVTVTLDPSDPVSIIQALRAVASHETLRVVARAELLLDEA